VGVYMKAFTGNIEWGTLGVGLVYFILRIIYEISHIKIINQITIILSIIVAIMALFISLILFFYEKKRKESIKPFIISIVLILVNFI